jgi:drug/metabolite transporter (DMT)-like permease
LGAGQHVSLNNAKGPLLVLLAPIAFAAYNVMAKPLIARHSPIAVSSAATLAGTVALLPFIRGSWVGDAQRMSALDWVLILYLGLICTLFAYIAWTLALNHLDASRTVAYLYGVPPLAVAIGAVALGEQVTAWLAAGAALVITGVALAQVRR